MIRLKILISLLLTITSFIFGQPPIDPDIEEEFNGEKLVRWKDYDDIGDYKSESYLDSIEIDTLNTKFLFPNRTFEALKLNDYSGLEESPIIDLNKYKQIMFQFEKAEIFPESYPDSIKPFTNFTEKLDMLNSDIINKNVSEYYIQMEICITNYKVIYYDNGSGNLSTVVYRYISSLPLKGATYRGGNVTFNFNSNNFKIFNYTTPVNTIINSIKVDFGDGIGYRNINFDQNDPFNTNILINYSTVGTKKIKTKVNINGIDYYSNSEIEVVTLEIPNPSMTIPLSGGGIPFLYTTGKAYVYLSDIESGIRNPIIFVEGFDIDNNMNADELYSAIRRQNLADSLKAYGYDIIIMNFSNARQSIKTNASLLIKLINEVNKIKITDNENIIIGASMGGLVSRYALAYMEKFHENHQTRLFVSFDSPQKGANIPLGVQYWLNFFSHVDGVAEDYRLKLCSEAAQEMLYKHFLTFPYPNNNRTNLYSQLSLLDNYPNYLRKIAISNGSAVGSGLEYGEGVKIIGWSYGEGQFDALEIDGDCWASGKNLTLVTECYMDAVWIPWTLNFPSSVYDYVQVQTNTEFDFVPGGTRSTHLEIAETDPPYGDITTSYEDHCFIPTISSLAIGTNDPFYNIKENIDEIYRTGMTPFDSLYYPQKYQSINQEHVNISEEMVQWLLKELLPLNVILEDEKVWGRGEITARNSIKLLPGYDTKSAIFLIKRIEDTE